MPHGAVYYLKYIYRQDLKWDRRHLYVFGDNLERFGLGGQAAEMRGESNAIGLPTKRSPERFLNDRDLDEVISSSASDRERLLAHNQAGGLIIWPRDGIGTGRAELATRAPIVKQFWQEFLLQLDPISPLLVPSTLRPELYKKCP